MSLHQLISRHLAPWTARLDPLEKWGAARREFAVSPSGGMTWLIVLIAAGGVLLAASVIAFVLYSRREQRRRHRLAFARQARQTGLTGEERNLLHTIAQLAGLKDHDAVFGAEQRYRLGVSRLISEDHLAAMGEEDRARALAVLSSLDGKLTFAEPEGPEQQQPESTRQVPEGTALEIVNAGGETVLKAVVSASAPDGLLLVPNVPVSFKPGRIGVAHFPRGGKMWEFDAVVAQSDEGTLRLEHSEGLRFFNRRRFTRVSVARSAKVAGFPFVRNNAEEEPLHFCDATLTELAGPGFKVTAPLRVAMGEKVLVVMRLSDGKTIEGFGIVRRTFPPADEQSVFALELLGLNATEVAELARETNAAAMEGAGQPPPEGAEDRLDVLVPEGSVT